MMSNIILHKKKKARRGNASRYRSVRQTLSKYDRYYPIYIGYSHQEPPVFEHASCALTWQMSRFLRDHIKMVDSSLPGWMHYVGTFSSDQCPVKVATLNDFSNSSSAFESNFFNGVKFYKIPELAKVVSGHGKATDDLFQLCASTLKEKCDYMSSSHSLYKKNATCINHPSDIIISPDSTVGNSKRENGLYEVGWSLKTYVKTSDFAGYGMFCFYINPSFVIFDLILIFSLQRTYCSASR